LPVELEGKTNMQKMKEIFAEQAKALKLPQFFIKVDSIGNFLEDEQK
jgi:type III restriction enzyme